MIDVEKLRRDCDGFRGRFFYDAEHGDLGYIAKDCDDRQCDCERNLDSDGNQDCSVSIADVDDVYEPIAGMLNAVPALIAEIEQLRVERDTARADAERYRAERGCPCLYVKPCHARCACLNQLSSSGCRRCCSYGSLDQRTAMAKRMAAAIDDAAPHHQGPTP